MVACTLLVYFDMSSPAQLPCSPVGLWDGQLKARTGLWLCGASLPHCFALVFVQGTRAVKRPRLVWTPELHKIFEAAVQKLGVDKAVPKTIMQVVGTQHKLVVVDF